jgi:RNA polymerase sigma factor (sigma-70 family)
MASPAQSTNSSDAELLGAGAGEFSELYRRWERPVLRFFLNRTGSSDLAADLAAETFARVWSERARFDPARGEVQSWVFGIARNLLAASYRRGQVEDRIRRRLGMERLVLDDSALERISQVAGEPALRALEALPEDQREAVRGRVLDERGYDELAAGMSCSESVVRQRVSRGLRALHLRLKESSQ